MDETKDDVDDEGSDWEERFRGEQRFKAHIEKSLAKLTPSHGLQVTFVVGTNMDARHDEDFAPGAIRDPIRGAQSILVLLHHTASRIVQAKAFMGKAICQSLVLKTPEDQRSVDTNLVAVMNDLMVSNVEETDAKTPGWKFALSCEFCC